MKDCGNCEKGIQSIIAGDPQFQELEDVVEHCRRCRDCRDLFEMHRTLARLGSRFDEMEPVNLTAVRSLIVKNVHAQDRRRSTSGWAAILRTSFTLRPLTAVGLLAVIFVLGLFVSRLRNTTRPPANEITIEGLSGRMSADGQNSPYSYSNVSVKYMDGDRVSLVFDVTKHVEVVEPAHSEMVKGILMYSVLHPAPTGLIGHFPTSSSSGKFFY